MHVLRIPTVITAGRTWPADEVAAQASRWRAEALTRNAPTAPLAVVVPPTPDAVPWLVAMTSLPTWIALLPSDPQGWPGLALPSGTSVVVPASMPAEAAAAQRLGCTVHVLSAATDRLGNDPVEPVAPLSGDGIVLFTSGSTAASRPAFRSTDALLGGCAARVHGLRLEHGDGIIAGTSMAHGAGLNRLIPAMLLGGPFGLLDPLDYRGALTMLARPEFTCWAATAHFADVLGRCALTGPAVVPRMCVIANPLPRAVHDRFLRRFGVPMRQVYSTTETGPISLDDGPADEVDPTTVGRPLPGVEIRIGDDVAATTGANETGRIWVRSPWQMSGYGFPPATRRSDCVDGWWPTSDLGTMRSDGKLMLAGRIDDCVRTREGRLVNLAEIASTLRGIHGVRAAAVVPIDGSSGTAFGAMVECEVETTIESVRERLTAALPGWARPRALLQVDALPRLQTGKVDCRQCVAMLGNAPS